MSYNWLFMELWVTFCLQDVGKLYFAFPYAVNRVIHDSIACYAHFHDAREGFRIGLI